MVTVAVSSGQQLPVRVDGKMTSHPRHPPLTIMSLRCPTWAITLLLTVIALCRRTNSSPAELSLNTGRIPETWRPLGSGSQGRVFSAPSEHDPGVLVAVKMRDSPAAASKEAAILLQLDHPAIPKLLSYHPGSVFFTMEYIEGRALGNVPHLGETRVIAIIRELADTLIYLLACRIAHQDLRLENVMLTPTDQLKLVDFGAAVSFAPNANGCQEAFFMQAHHWEARHVSDVWALQHILLQLGHAPHRDPRDLTPRLREIYNCLTQYTLLRGVDDGVRGIVLRRCFCKGEGP